MFSGTNPLEPFDSITKDADPKAWISASSQENPLVGTLHIRVREDHFPRKRLLLYRQRPAASSEAAPQNAQITLADKSEHHNDWVFRIMREGKQLCTSHDSLLWITEYPERSRE